MDELRVAIRVRPGAAREAVGGRYGTDQLVVAVTARAADGAANRAVIAAVAGAFGVRPADVGIVTGRTARSKLIVIGGAREALQGRLDALLAGDHSAARRRGE
ncbi:MAG TPA: DUF167 domain-containing protein [Jatrophihabitans sp.]|jgi:uncharacterized protein (TIGR00251 family)|nr:DUF167 domain-containing protein [Jatrophihabitans sp.]